MDLSNKTFLVTGGAGFIGSSLVKELLKHDVKKVVIYDNFSRGKNENISNSGPDAEGARCDTTLMLFCQNFILLAILYQKLQRKHCLIQESLTSLLKTCKF